MVVAIVGITGLVGKKMAEILQERNFPVERLIPVASSKSAGKKIVFNGNEYTVVLPGEAVNAKPDVALFSAGSSVSRVWAPRFAEKGTYVVDNSSAWRMKEHIPLIVPEINAGVLTGENHIIANPNCSTIQLVMALAPLHKAFRIKRLVIATYQSVTGSGAKGLLQLQREQQGNREGGFYPHPIHMNVLPHAGDFSENGYTTEELKLVNETRKILNDPSLKITATAARVPVTGGHSEAVNAEFEQPFTVEKIKTLLNNTPGVEVMDEPETNTYPTPRIAHDKDTVFVGRIRKDLSVKNGLNLWIVSDNLRKGAATNAVQIAEYLLKNNFIKKHAAN